jgi:hypothetical protein
MTPAASAWSAPPRTQIVQTPQSRSPRGSPKPATSAWSGATPDTNCPNPAVAVTSRQPVARHIRLVGRHPGRKSSKLRGRTSREREAWTLSCPIGPPGVQTPRLASTRARTVDPERAVRSGGRPRRAGGTGREARGRPAPGRAAVGPPSRSRPTSPGPAAARASGRPAGRPAEPGARGGPGQRETSDGPSGSRPTSQGRLARGQRRTCEPWRPTGYHTSRPQAGTAGPDRLER